MSDSYYVELANGVRIVAKQLPEESYYGLNCYVRFGEKHVDHNQTGLPHYLEHLIFDGTSTKTAEEIANTILKFKGGFGASTFADKTVYTMHAMKEDQRDNLSEMADLVGDVLTNSVFHQEKIDHERQVILNELFERQDNLDSNLHELGLKAHFRGHAYERPAIGTVQTIQDFQRNDFLNLLASYTGEKITVGITGPDPAEEMAGPLIQAFSRIKKGLSPQKHEAPIFQSNESPRMVEQHLHQNHFKIFVPLALSEEHPYHYGAGFISAILGNRCNKLRESFSKSYGIRINYSTYEDAAHLTFSGSTRPETSDAYLEQAALLIRGIKNGFTRQEYDEVVVPKAREMADVHKYSFQYMEWMIEDLHYRGKIFDPQTRLEEYRKISYEQANEFLKQCIPDDITLVHKGPATDFMAFDHFRELAHSPDNKPAISAKSAFPGLKNG